MRIGILNCSDIARKRIIPAIQSIPGCTIPIVCSRSIEKAHEYADEFDIPKCTDSIWDMFEEDLDAVYISSPPGKHFEQMVPFLSHGINILCEKSLTTDYKQTKGIIKEADDSGLIVQENYGFPFHKQWAYIKKHLDTIGPLVNIRAAFEFPPRDKETDFRYDPELGGGALMDAGGYPIKLATLLMDEPEMGQLSGRSTTCIDTGVDINGDVYFVDRTFGTSAFLSWSFDSPYRCQVEISGVNGRIKSDKIFTPRADEVVRVEVIGKDNTVVSDANFQCDHFRELILDFMRRIKEKDNSHHRDIVKQAKWQDYAKTICFRTISYEL